MKSTSAALHLARENGDIKTSATLGGAATDVHKMDEFDIKILQQKRHEAEVKRYVFHNVDGYKSEVKRYLFHNDFFFRKFFLTVDL